MPVSRAGIALLSQSPAHAGVAGQPRLRALAVATMVRGTDAQEATMGGIELECGCSFARSMFGKYTDELVYVHLCQQHSLLLLGESGVTTVEQAVRLIEVLNQKQVS